MPAETAQRERYRREILSYFHKHSRNYDLSAAVISLGAIGRVRRRTVEMLALKRGDRVLDICTGTGETALYLLRAGYRAVGIDFSMPMLRQAVKKGLHTRAPFVHGDALCLPFRDRSFHGATISFGLHEMPVSVMEEIIQESARLLVPDGKLMVTDWNLPSNPLVRALFNPLIDAFETRYCRGFLETDLVCLMRRHGLRLESQRFIGFGCVAIRCFQLAP